jgi:hypothetical protein
VAVAIKALFWHQQYFAQAYHCWPLCFLTSSGNQTSHTVKHQNISCAIYERQQISVRSKKVRAEEGSLKDELMQTVLDVVEINTYNDGVTTRQSFMLVECSPRGIRKEL